MIAHARFQFIDLGLQSFLFFACIAGYIITATATTKAPATFLLFLQLGLGFFQRRLERFASGLCHGHLLFHGAALGLGIGRLLPKSGDLLAQHGLLLGGQAIVGIPVGGRRR